MPADDVKFLLRIPKGLDEKLRGRASAECRSLNEMICVLLEGTDGDEQRGSKATPNEKGSLVRKSEGQPRTTTRSHRVGAEVPEAPLGVEKSAPSKVKKLSVDEFLKLSNSEKLRAQREGREP